MKSITHEAQETDSIPGLNGFESVRSVPTLQEVGDPQIGCPAALPFPISCISCDS